MQRVGLLCHVALAMCFHSHDVRCMAVTSLCAAVWMCDVLAATLL
jgi:hypothetical protein